MARELGCDPTEWLDTMRQTYYLRAAGRLGEPMTVLHDTARMLGGRPSRRTLRRIHGERISTVGTDGPLRPAAAPVLRGLRARGLRTAVVSDCWYELPALLPGLPVYDLLDAHVFSLHVGHCKPHPDMYLTACERLGVAPAECLYVGDGGSRELTGAEAMGMTAIQLDAPDLSEHLTFSHDAAFRGRSITSLWELLPLVDRSGTGSAGDLAPGGTTIGN